MDPLGTDSCRETVPMEPLMPNGSMQHQEPKSEIADTRIILQGASCIIAPAGHIFGRMATEIIKNMEQTCWLRSCHL
jgi:hypothetical protein